MPVAKTTAVRLAAGAGGAAEDHVGGLEQRPRVAVGRRRAQHRQRLAGQRGDVDLERAGEQPGVGGDPVALGDHDDVTGHQLARVDRAPAPSRATVACGGRYAVSASTARSACRSWTNANTALSTITTTIATASDGRAAQPGQHGGRPQQQRQRVDELPAELPRPGAAAAAYELVGPVHHEPAGGLAVGEALADGCAGPAAAGRALSSGSTCGAAAGPAAGPGPSTRRPVLRSGGLCPPLHVYRSRRTASRAEGRERARAGPAAAPTGVLTGRLP